MRDGKGLKSRMATLESLTWPGVCAQNSSFSRVVGFICSQDHGAGKERRNCALEEDPRNCESGTSLALKFRQSI